MDNITQKDIDSFETIYNRFYTPVYRFLLKRLPNKELSEDLTSEVFYTCLKNFSKYDPSKAAIATWIYTIAKNKLKNYFRDRKEVFSIEYKDFSNAFSYEADMDEAIFLTQMNTHLIASFETVSERERKIIELRYLSGFTSDEIAKEVGTSAGNVRVILTRTLKKLNKYFEDNRIRWD